MSAKRQPIICVGHAALDRVYAVDTWPAESGKIPVNRFEESGGGMAANAAAAISRLGSEVRFWGPTGDDPVADAIRAQLDADGVDTTNLKAFPGRTSSHSAVLVDGRGERLVVGYRGTALQAPAGWLPLDQVGNAGAVLADVRWPEGAAASLQAARSEGRPAILDAEIAEAAVLERLCGIADHILFSERGLEAWAGSDWESGLRRLVAGGARIAAVTRGPRGVQWVDRAQPQRMNHFPAFAVEVVDTLAAGDVFHGAYALSVAEAQPIEEAMRFASAAAAIKCSRPGGRKGAPGRAEVEVFLRKPIVA